MRLTKLEQSLADEMANFEMSSPSSPTTPTTT